MNLLLTLTMEVIQWIAQICLKKTTKTGIGDRRFLTTAMTRSFVKSPAVFCAFPVLHDLRRCPSDCFCVPRLQAGVGIGPKGAGAVPGAVFISICDLGEHGVDSHLRAGHDKGVYPIALGGHSDPFAVPVGDGHFAELIAFIRGHSNGDSGPPAGIPVAELHRAVGGAVRRAADDQTELAMLTARDELNRESLRLMQKSGEALARTRHDILGNLSILQSLCREGDYKKPDDYLARLTRQTGEIVPLWM